MFTEYVFDNKEYDVGVRNLKATMFDIVASEEANMAALQEKVASEGDEDLQARLVELSDSQNTCLRNIVRITNALVETMQELDSYSKELKQIEQESVEKKLAGIENTSEPVLANANVNEQSNYQANEEAVVSDVQEHQASATDVFDDTMNQPEEVTTSIEENDIPEIQESSLSEVGASEDVVQPMEESDNEVASPVDEIVVSDNQEISGEAVQQSEENVENSIPQTDIGNVDISTGETSVDPISPVVGDEANSSEVPPIVTTEDVITDTELPPIPTIDDNEPGVENTNSTVIDVPEIGESISQPTEVVDNSSFELPIVEADGLNNAVVQPQESSVVLPAVTFTRVGDSADRAILVTNKQSTNLRNSRDMQKQLVQIASSGVTENQLVDSGLLEPSVDDKKKKIEEMLENANSLYKQGNVQEAEVLYDEISKLNKELQGEEEKVLVA